MYATRQEFNKLHEVLEIFRSDKSKEIKELKHLLKYFKKECQKLGDDYSCDNKWDKMLARAEELLKPKP